MVDAGLIPDPDQIVGQLYSELRALDRLDRSPRRARKSRGSQRPRREDHGDSIVTIEGLVALRALLRARNQRAIASANDRCPGHVAMFN